MKTAGKVRSERARAAQEHIPARLRDVGIAQLHPYPRATRGNGKIGRHMSLQNALFRRRLQLNPKNTKVVITLDIDHDQIEVIPWTTSDGDDPFRFHTEWRIVGPLGRLLRPSWVVQDDRSRKAHVAYVLESPVHMNPHSRNRPQLWLKQIEKRLRRAWRGDEAYDGIITRNPIRPGPGVSAYFMRPQPFTLHELAEANPPKHRASPVKVMVKTAPTDRGNILFRTAVKAIFRPKYALPILDDSKDAKQLVEALNHKIASERGSEPQSEHVVEQVAGQAEAYLRLNYDRDVFVGKQRLKGLWGGIRRRQAIYERNRLIVRLRHVGRQSVASITQRLEGTAHAIQRRQIYRVLEQALAGRWGKPRPRWPDSFAKFAAAAGVQRRGNPLISESRSSPKPDTVRDTPITASGGDSILRPGCMKRGPNPWR